jgi:peptidoglycan/LPS O-acetylase OafA/YrhL
VFTGKIYTHTFSYFDALLLGACIPVFKLEMIENTCKRILFFSSGILLLLSGLIIYTDKSTGPFYIKNYLSDLGIIVHYTEYYYYVWSYVVINFFFFTLLLTCTNNHSNPLSFQKNIFTSKPLVEIGKISYGMYVLHIFVNWMLAWILEKSGISVSKYVFFCLDVILLFIISKAVYLLVEKKFLVLKDKFR